MIPELRKRYNASFTPEKYRRFVKRLNAISGTTLEFRISETPCFLPRSLVETMIRSGREVIEQLVDPAYHALSARSIPAEYNVPNEDAHPQFVQVDFGLVQDDQGVCHPRLVEIQAFPTLYALQPVLAQQYREVFDFDRPYLLEDRTLDCYQALLRRTILGDHNPENVVLLEIEPTKQKTLPDFILTDRLCGTRTLCVSEVIKQGKKLFYRLDGQLVPIHRIYNRVIVDELVRRKPTMSFHFSDELDVEWAGHPNWFFRISKFSIPYLRHSCVPATSFLSELKELPAHPEQFVLKPLYSFAGSGVIVGPTREQIEAVPEKLRPEYILQERVAFTPVIATPQGPTQAEIRIMYLWLEQLEAVTSIVRMGRGLMMGVDHNKNMEWVGASAAFYE